MLYQRGQTLLQLHDVSVSYGQRKILRDINFEIKDVMRPNMVQGQIVALLGRSGVGKSTLFGLMAGLRRPDTGIVLQGTDLKPVIAGDMGVVYQNYYMFGWRKVRTLLQAAISKNGGIAPADRKDVLEQTASDLNLSKENLDCYPSQLSGGQAQRAAIAEQILAGSEFLLLDEPFSGLDVLTIDKVMNILIKVANTDELKTLIIVSHDLANTIAIADTVYVMAKTPEKEGATIIKEIDLIERGLAWEHDVKEKPEFVTTLKEIKSLL